MSGFPTIDALRESLAGPPRPKRDPAYVARMMHEVPDAVVVDRVPFIAGRAAGKTVLDVGASGELHDAIVASAAKVYGIDRPGSPADFALDLDAIDGVLPAPPGVELVVCGEVIEHLSNPGWLLTRLRSTFPGVPVIVTVPNGFSDIARRHLERDEIENVHVEHCAWYSWRTLKTLVEKSGYKVSEFYWQNGRPLFAEGLIFVLE